MTKRFLILLVVLTIVSGLIGGAITGRIFIPKVAIAEKMTQSKILTVEELRVVDKDGKLLMKLGTLVDREGLGITPESAKDPYESLYNHGLDIYDDSGDSKASISVFRDGGYVRMSGKGDTTNSAAAVIGVNKLGGKVMISAEGGKPCVMMYTTEDDGFVSVFSKDGKVVTMESITGLSESR